MKLFIGTPLRGSIHRRTFHAITKLRRGLEALEIPYVEAVEERGNLDIAHSLLAGRMLATDCTHLLLIHSDVCGFTAEDVVRMMRADVGVVGGPIPGRSNNPDRIRAALDAGASPEDALLQASPRLFWELPQGAAATKNGHLVEVLAMSTGFLLIKREVFEALHRAGVVRSGTWEGVDLTAYFEQDLVEDRGQWASEDMAFCLRCRSISVPIWADTKTALQHAGEWIFESRPLALDLRARVTSQRTFRAAMGFSFASPSSCESEARAVLAGQYELGLDFPEPPSVLDLGANVGSFARWALQRWPGARVDCYEPQGGDVAEALHANAARTCGLVTVHELAVTRGGADEIELHVRDDHPISTSATPHPNARAVRVPAIDSAELPDANVLKLDIEGDEAAVLERYLSRDRRALEGVAVEWHSESDREALRGVLAAHGFHILAERPLHPDRIGIGVILASRRPKLRPELAP